MMIPFVHHFPHQTKAADEAIYRVFLRDQVLGVNDPQHQLPFRLVQSLNELPVAIFNFLVGQTRSPSGLPIPNPQCPHQRIGRLRFFTCCSHSPINFAAHTPQFPGRKLTALQERTIRSRSGPTKPENAAVFTAAFSCLTTEMPQRISVLTTWRAPLFRSVRLFTAAQNLRGLFPQNSCPGSFNFSLGGKLRSNSSAAASST